jgi:N-acetylglucosamine-6-phosphate deacetylase
LKLEGRGLVEPGAHADVVILNDELRVMKTFAEGRLVFEGHS